MTYITSRGRWYQYSWKGDLEKSGGIATNIGLHFFDVLAWVFGAPTQSVVHVNRADCAAGFVQHPHARVRWFLSVNPQHVPGSQAARGLRTYRSITVDGSEVEFSEGFTDLHTESYRQILAGNGFGLDVARDAVQMVYDIRRAPIASNGDGTHPMVRSI